MPLLAGDRGTRDGSAKPASGTVRPAAAAPWTSCRRVNDVDRGSLRGSLSFVTSTPSSMCASRPRFVSLETGGRVRVHFIAVNWLPRRLHVSLIEPMATTGETSRTLIVNIVDT
jgi:hypothetical protein